MEPEVIADYQNEVGEGPTWHPMEQRLYWLDIPAGLIYSYDPATGQHGLYHRGEVTGGITVQADGALLLFMAGGAVASLRDGQLTYIIKEIPEERNGRFNDVIADPAGRVFCGTMPTEGRPARLYRLDTDGTLTVVVEDVGVSNGLGFTPDRRQMYYTDTLARKIYIFDYAADTGDISNQRVFVETPAGEGLPDGMTVDADGHVWSARAHWSALYRYSPQGIVERSIGFPAKLVSSVTFGGPDYTDIYVTTIGGNKKAEEGPGAGALFRLNLGIKGVPEFYSRVGL